MSAQTLSISTPRNAMTSRVLATAAATVAIASALVTGVLVAVNHANIPAVDGADPISLVMPVTFGLVGLLVASRQPRNPCGWLFLFIAIDQNLSGVGDQYARLALITHPGSLPGAVWALWYASWASSVVWPCGVAAVLLMLLPDGHLPSARWRPLAMLNLAFTALFLVLTVFQPVTNGVTDNAATAMHNPIGMQVFAFESSPQGPAVALYYAELAVALAAATAPFVRLRRAQGGLRQQLKWIAYAVLVSAILVAVATLLYTWVPTIGSLGSTLSIALGFGLALPAAAALAIFKYRLYDIDVVISRTLVYGTLAVLITGVYVGIAVGIGELVGSGGKPNLGLSILATAIVAVGFQPARERLQTLANRVVYGRRATPYEVLSEFASHVAGSYAADDVLPRMAKVLREGTAAQAATVWLQGDGERYAAASDPEGSASGGASEVATRVVDVYHHGELLGALSVVKRRGESLTPVEEKLVSDLAHQAGLVLRNVRITADLQRRLEDLRASRQRLVSAQDAERRRLERNLHDGAQQHLVALKVKLGLAEMLAVRNPDQAKATLQQLKGDTDEALETLRDLARGIYPPLLADKGLVTALESQASKAILPVRVVADGVARYAQEIEATVYFCVLEALQNVQKYAAATHAEVTLRSGDGMLRFSVHDDGRGFDAASAKRGAGLTNMEDRLDAIGGVLTLESAPGRGTTVRGSVPTSISAGQLSTAGALAQ